MKLQNKIIFTIVVLIIFFGTIATITTFFLTHRDFTEQLSENLITSTLSQSQESYQILRQSKDLTLMLSERITVREYLTNPKDPVVKEKVENAFLDGYNLGKMYSAIYLLDTQGIGKVSTDARFVGQDYSFRNYFIDAKAGKNSFSVAMGITSKELGYYFSAPIYSTKNDKEIVGVAVFKLIPKFIEDSLLEHVRPGFNILLTDQSGIVIFTSDNTKLFSSLGPLSESVKRELAKNNTYGTMQLPVLDYEILMDKIPSASDHAQTFQIMDKKDNKKEIVSLIKIGDFPLYLIFEGNLDSITQLSLKSASAVAGLVAIEALTSVIILMIILKSVLHQQKIIEDKIEYRSKELEKLNNLMVGRELKMIELKQKISDLEGKK